MTGNAALKKHPAEKRLLARVANKELTPTVPFWLMRQAGRYLPEYRELRKTAGSFLDLCFTPELAAEVTLQPLRRFDMDAAILFSDILVVPYALGQPLDFLEGEGPKLGPLPDVGKFSEKDFDEKLQPVYETVGLVREKLDAGKTLIGFAGAPWTVACYMVQGCGDGVFDAVKKRAFGDPAAFDSLIDPLATATAHYLIKQIRHGADVVQVFDSWAGLLPEEYFRRWVVSPTRKIVEAVHRVFPGFPVIGFPRGAGDFYREYAESADVSCIGIDQHFSMDRAVRECGGRVALQGNLDPALLLAGGKPLEEGALRILDAARNVPFIFNLGHGVIKETPPEHVAQLAALLKAYRR